MPPRDNLNSICPYYTMFPVDFPLRILSQANSNQIVVDPYCGRGTTLYAGRQNFLTGYGIDTSPIAAAVARAKIVSASPSEIMSAYDLIIKQNINYDIPTGKFWRKAYHPKTLKALCALRAALISSFRDYGENESSAITILRGVVLGALHGPLTKGPTPSSFFSNQMMRTFAAKPNYAVKYWLAHKLNPPYSDIREVISRRVNRLLKTVPAEISGSHVYHGDARKRESYLQLSGPIDWVVTSPPYYGMNTYEADQWIRLWFLGGQDKPVYSNTNQISHRCPSSFAKDLASVWDRIAEHASPEIKMVVRFGAIGSRKVNYRDIFAHSLQLSGASWRLKTSKSAGSADDGRRQSPAMGKHGRPNSIEERDFYVDLH